MDLNFETENLPVEEPKKRAENLKVNHWLRSCRVCAV